MTKRKKIATTFASELSTISVAGGYRVNFPVVKHWSTDIEPKVNQKTVVVRDRVISNTEDAESEKETLMIEIILACSIPEQNYDTINDMIDDIKKWFNVKRKDLEISLNCPEIRYVNDEIIVEKFEQDMGGGKVTFSVVTGQNSNWIYDSTEY